jgi:uncharacterized cupin superfamily protein
VISGSVMVLSSAASTEIGPADFVLLPSGDDAHQLTNDGAEMLGYLAMSASKGVGVTEYPDSRKVQAVVGAEFEQPGLQAEGRRRLFRRSL